jgi:glycosyltransferase involved in cell wall biosynthesis
MSNPDSGGSSAADRPELSVIVPVWNEEGSIEKFLRAMSAVLDAAGIRHHEYVFVDDGSTDGTWDEIQSLITSSDRSVLGVRLSRNVGKEAALTAGLEQARGRAHVPMDVDLQDPPWVVVEMHEHWRRGAKVVVAKRRQRDEGWAKRLTAAAFYRLANLGEREVIPAQVGDFRLMDAAITARFLRLPERSRFNKGLLALVSSRPEVVEYDRPATREGRPRQNWRRLFSLALDGLVSFTTWPLRLISTLGFVLVLASVVAVVLSVALRLAHVIKVPGQATVIVMGLFLLGLQALSLGVLGEYISRILVEVKSRPLYYVDEIRRSSSAPHRDDGRDAAP